MRLARTNIKENPEIMPTVSVVCQWCPRCRIGPIGISHAQQLRGAVPLHKFLYINLTNLHINIPYLHPRMYI